MTALPYTMPIHGEMSMVARFTKVVARMVASMYLGGLPRLFINNVRLAHLYMCFNKPISPRVFSGFFLGAKAVNHGKAVVVSLHLDGIGVPGITAKKIITELFAGFEDFRKAGVIMAVGFNGEVKKFECTVNGFAGASRVAFGGPFERARHFAADVAHLVGDWTS